MKKNNAVTRNGVTYFDGLPPDKWEDSCQNCHSSKFSVNWFRDSGFFCNKCAISIKKNAFDYGLSKWRWLLAMKAEQDNLKKINELKTTIRGCVRCGDTHENLLLIKLTNTCDHYTHFAMCPKLDEPIMVEVALKFPL